MSRRADKLPVIRVLTPRRYLRALVRNSEYLLCMTDGEAEMLVSVSPPRGPNASQTYVVQPAAHHPQEVHDARDGSAKQVLPDHSTTVAAARLNSLAPAFPPLPSISALPVRINLRTMANLVLVVCCPPVRPQVRRC